MLTNIRLVEEKIEYETLYPAIDGHPRFVPENYTIEFDMYLFSPASGPRKDDSEDWCFVNFCDQEFMPGPTRSIFVSET